MKRPRTVEELYAEGKRFPLGRHSAQESAPWPRGAVRPPAKAEQKPQHREDQPAPGYSNDTKAGWLTGAGAKGATAKPSFDKTAAWRGGKLRED
jgi:hypothetical protein